ncbi:HlyD family secretion protein [Bordetella holmesii]|uniref:HlyD family secretion protein n=1 Tax=Bordetella holmesii CDC-H585-BH TaxID=1331206 RepID=A0A158M5U9_9BORD|nr:HlyD family efflux transporter periplasmic adaptor subunit [Bordetella holmesii]EWM41157.1 efflux transporter, RND family, MFP subunit [Bordetella holmesii 35009]KAK82253.1 HlyD family secretion protein [Bordetella holmesii CDC-H572-BH]KAK89401.1 HlyD family secretion protein [Bordetella holmesii H620]KAK91164.1 HlyD family secretion protein [Bordetella holmesii CDC-H585-BH]KCV01699.1 HlyD family secretion protein [Bordetella holmesii CDC-H719-BH]
MTLTDPTPMTRFARLAAAALACGLVAACGRESNTAFQGYAEGDFVAVAPTQSGRLLSLDVERGQQVPQAGLLFTLDHDKETAARDEAQARLTAAQAQLADTASGKRPPEVAVVRSQLARAQAEQTRTDAQLARDTRQYQDGGISRQELDNTRASANANRAQVRELQAQLEVATLPARDQQRQAQQADVQAAAATLAQADWSLAQRRVQAPAQSLVFDTLYRPGEWVNAGSPVVRLLPPGNIKLRFFVPQDQVGRLRVGQPLSIACDGCGGAIPAHISYIATQAEYTPPVIYSREVRDKLVFLVEARPQADQATRLHPGQPVDVRLDEMAP